MTSDKKGVKERKHTCLLMCLRRKQYLMVVTVKQWMRMKEEKCETIPLGGKGKAGLKTHESQWMSSPRLQMKDQYVRSSYFYILAMNNQKTIPSIIASKRRASYILGVWVLILGWGAWVRTTAARGPRKVIIRDKCAVVLTQRLVTVALGSCGKQLISDHIPATHSGILKYPQAGDLWFPQN